MNNRIVYKGTIIEIVEVTPSLAAEWLERDVINRPISQVAVHTYAGDMRDLRWDWNGNTIVLGRNGEVLDGQHRLWAVIETGLAVPFIVVKNVSDAAKLSIDSGRVRRHSDRLHMFAGVERPAAVAASLSLLEQVLHHRPGKVSTHELWKRYEEHRVGFDWALAALGQSRMTIAPIYAALVYAYPKYPAEIDELARQLQVGEGLRRFDPAWTLREYLNNTPGISSSREARIETFGKTLRAAQAAIQGDKIQKLYVSKDSVEFFRVAVAEAA